MRPSAGGARHLRLPRCRYPGETGLLAPPDDPPALAVAIERLIAALDFRARYGAAARRRPIRRSTHRACDRESLATHDDNRKDLGRP
jgi:glycosyltransferase involved in cell wall biosynthesis